MVFIPSSVFIGNSAGFDNDIPDAAKRKGNPFWRFVGNMLREAAPSVDFIHVGVPGHHGGSKRGPRAVGEREPVRSMQ
jgi:hypothetical protein